MGLADIHIDSQTILSNLLVVNDDEFLEILQGLQKEQKTLPSKLFYDQQGSLLFDQICKLEEYYLTRTETEIMRQNIHQIVDLIGPECTLIEYGSGSSVKTRIMLDHLHDIVAYIPVDISKDHLFNTTENLNRTYPKLVIFPLWADFTKTFSLPIFQNGTSRKIVYFPGSTIGNLYPQQAIDFLRSVAALIGKGGGLLIGIDLKKDPNILNRAYNDSKGITAAFNLNILAHLNRKLNANFVESQFEHLAFYNQYAGRIEMHLISRQDQDVVIGGRRVHFQHGERVLTEVSYKYSIAGFASIAAQAGFDLRKVWADPNNYFSVQFLVAN